MRDNLSPDPRVIGAHLQAVRCSLADDPVAGAGRARINADAFPRRLAPSLTTTNATIAAVSSTGCWPTDSSKVERVGQTRRSAAPAPLSAQQLVRLGAGMNLLSRSAKKRSDGLPYWWSLPKSLPLGIWPNSHTHEPCTLASVKYG